MRLFLKEIKDLKETEVEIRYSVRDEEVESLIAAPIEAPSTYEVGGETIDADDPKE